MPGSPLALAGAGRGAGFTLLELMVAIAVAALLLTAVPPLLSRGLDTMQYRTAVRELVAGLKGARRAAMETGRSVAFTVDTAAHRFGVDPDLEGSIPGELQVRLTVAETEIEDPDRGAIRFYPDGSATGGSIELLRPAGGGVRLRVDWLLGRISQEPPEPR